MMHDGTHKGLCDGGRLPDIGSSNQENLAAAMETLSDIAFELRKPVAMEDLREAQLLRVYEISKWLAAVSKRMAVELADVSEKQSVDDMALLEPEEISHVMLVGLLINLGGKHVMPACFMEPSMLEGDDGLPAVTMELLPNDFLRFSLSSRPDGEASGVAFE